MLIPLQMPSTTMKMKLPAYCGSFVPIFLLILHSTIGQMLYQKIGNECARDPETKLLKLRLMQNTIDYMNLKDEMRALKSDIESGKIQSPRRFLPVYFSAWNTKTLYNIEGRSTIVYDKVITNEGNAYSNATGKFTAPRDGPFVFTWTAIVTDNYMINVFIYHNDNRLSVAQADSEFNDQNSSGSNSIVLNLKRYDVVELKCGMWGNQGKHKLEGDAHSAFSGWAL